MYNASIKEFKNTNFGEIYSKIDHSVENSQRSGLQKFAWDGEIQFLQEALKTDEGQIIFEYSIPRIAKRIDVVLLIRNIVFVLEFKVGENDSKSARKQTKQYAQALKWYHSASQGHIIVPILITTEGRKRNPSLKQEKDDLYDVILCNRTNLWEVISEVLERHPAEDDREWNRKWANGKYNPTPTIIDATCYRYVNNNVKEIRESEADANQISAATQFLVEKIRETKQKGEKAIFFVTGVPGAGKTLVGLDLVAETQREFNSVFLSGNGPLVDVLTEALTQDSRNFNKLDDGIEELKPESMIQLIHRYRKNAVNKVKGISKDGILLMEGDSNEIAEVEHVVVFDEAQRAWTREKLMSPGRSGRTTILQHPDFPYSEPAFLIWSLDLRKDWVAVVCLVGGGQEINTGEAGILEWIKAIKNHFPQWHVYISPNLSGPEYAGEKLMPELMQIVNVSESSDLHLGVSRRSLRAEKVSDFVKALLDGDINEAKLLYQEFKDKFPIVLTRDVEKGKQWLRERKAESVSKKESGKIGMLMSSKAFRLRPYGYEIKKVGEYKNVGKWFLRSDDDVESSDYLEVALSEFFVQGLELDWTGVIWDADFRDVDCKKWAYYSGFNGRNWIGEKIALKSDENLADNQQYQKNAYRVILTRARRGMIIIVPKGDKNDLTRPSSNYVSTYYYLKSLGIEEI